MDPLTVAVVAGAAAGGFVQGLTGTFFGLVALAVWAWTLEPSLAAPLIVLGSLVGQLLSIGSLKRGFSLGRIWPFIVGGLIGLPLGVVLLQRIDPQVFKLAVGVLLAVVSSLMLFARDLPTIERGGKAADGAIGFVGGVMGGLGGLSSVIPSLWTSLRGWDRDAQRSVLQGFNLTMFVFAMAAYAAAGTFTAEALALFPATILATVGPALLGGALYKRFSDATFRKAILALLALSGLVLIATTLPKML